MSDPPEAPTLAVERWLNGNRPDPALLALLQDASGRSGDALERLARTELPNLTVLTARADGELVGIAAYVKAATVVTIEYLAVSASRRGCGLGSALVSELARLTPGAVLVAETDDDAVAFYRRLGFAVKQRASDPRWPGRRRYRCVLPATGESAQPPPPTLPS